MNSVVWGCLYPVWPASDRFELQFPLSALSNIFIVHYVSLNPYPTTFTPLKTSLSVGELSVNWWNLTTMYFCCSSPFSPKWKSQSTRSQGRWDTRVLDHKALLTLMICWETNKSAIFSPSAIGETSEIPKPLLPHFTMEPFLFKWSLKLEL